MNKIFFLDTTLRDGAQTYGINFSLQAKIKISQALYNFGLDFIEAGFPGSNPKDEEFFQKTKKSNFQKKLVSFSSTVNKNKTPATDPLIQKVLKTETNYVTVFGKVWNFQTAKILKINHKKALEIIYETISFFRRKNFKVIFDAEHFFDGYKAKAKFALACLKEAQRAGAFNLTLCDTNGGTLPNEMQKIIRAVQQEITHPLGIHAHNDSEVAVANCLMAFESGVELIQTTINGLGERAGNASYNSVLSNLQLKLKQKIIAPEKLKELTNLAKLVNELANLSPQKNQPFTGENAFRHKGGMHASAVALFPRSYEHIKPELIGQTSSVTVSELSGRSNIVLSAKRLGFNLKKDSEIVETVLKKVKSLEKEGFYFEIAEASFILLILHSQKNYQKPFILEDHLVVQTNNNQVKAMVKVRVGEDSRHFAASGDGPVDALNLAVRKAVARFFPIIEQVELTDYKVRILNSETATAAKTRVLIESKLGQTHWTTVGCSENIIIASLQALLDSFEFAIWRENKVRLKLTKK